MAAAQINAFIFTPTGHHRARGPRIEPWMLLDRHAVPAIFRSAARIPTRTSGARKWHSARLAPVIMVHFRNDVLGRWMAQGTGA